MPLASKEIRERERRHVIRLVKKSDEGTHKREEEKIDKWRERELVEIQSETIV